MNLNALVNGIIEASKTGDWEAQHNAFCALSEHVCRVDAAAFDRGYEMGSRHAKISAGEKVESRAMHAIVKHGGLRAPPLCAM